LEKIPLKGALKLDPISQNSDRKSSDSKNDSITELKVFASENKNYIALSTRKLVKDDRDSLYGNTFIDTSAIELYDSKGKLKWSESMANRHPSECMVSNTGDFVSVAWKLKYEGRNISKLSCYDKNGKEVFRDDDIEYLYSGTDKNIIYYTKDIYYSGNPENAKKLFCINLANNNSWEKTFNAERVSVLAVSGNGENALCHAGNLYLLDKKGSIIWEKNYPPFHGTFSLSGNAEYLIQSPGAGTCFVYDIKNNKILFKKEKNK